jgi:hypothetical protein
MAKPDDKVVPSEGQSASNSEDTAASASQETLAADALWAEVSKAMRLADEAVSDAMRSADEALSNAERGMVKGDNKQ